MPSASVLLGTLCLFELLAFAKLPQFEHNAHVHFAVRTLIPTGLVLCWVLLLVRAVLVTLGEYLCHGMVKIGDLFICLAANAQAGLYSLSDVSKSAVQCVPTPEFFLFAGFVMTVAIAMVWPGNSVVQYGAVCSFQFACGGRVHPYPVWVNTVNACVCKCIVPKTLLERSPAAGSSKGCPPPPVHGRSQAAGSSKSRPPTPVHGQTCHTVHPLQCPVQHTAWAGAAWAFTPTHCVCECVLTSPASQPCNGRNYTHESAHSDPPPEHGRHGQNSTCVPPESTWYDTAEQVMHYAVACGVSAVGGAVWLLLTN